MTSPVGRHEAESHQGNRRPVGCHEAESHQGYRQWWHYAASDIQTKGGGGH